METPARCTRRTFLVGSSATIALASSSLRAHATTEAQPAPFTLIEKIRDPEIRAGMDAAITKNLLPAATERQYPGHFTINADGGGYGSDTTWPGLDSWQMTGAYLLLGRTRMVLDYFEFVRASQRKDGNIPFAIFSGGTKPGGCLRGLKSPDDIFTYKPPKREGLPASSQETRRWIGLFEHWQTLGYPLSTLGPICYLLTAAEIFDATRSTAWVRERLASLEAAAKHLLSRRTAGGLIGGSGFYTEAPPRSGRDGVTQCYTVHAWRELARICATIGEKDKEASWSGKADALASAFVSAFWRKDHFGEYVHPERGLVDSHGLSDVNWAAVAFGIATDAKLDALWSRLMSEPAFWLGGMPTQTVTKPSAYELWEINQSAECPASPLNDVAAMGRVWYIEALACRRMRAHDRLVDAVRKVCRAGRPSGYWRERYHPKPDGSVSADGSQKYCEYPAVLTRVVLGNRDLFFQ